MKEKKVFFKNSKGQKLSGILHIPENKEPSPIVITCHGLSTGKGASSVRDIVSLLIKSNIAVFSFDFHGHGESEGEFEDVTVTQGIDDLKNAIEFVIKQPLVDKSKIGLFGSSFGGIISIYTAIRDKRIKVLALKAPLIDYKKSLESRKLAKGWKEKGYRLYEAWDGAKKLKYSFALDAMKYNVLPDVKKVKIPTLIAIGTEDRTVMSEVVEEFYKALNCEKKIVWLKNETHAWTSKAKKKGLSEIANWFKRYLK